MQMTFRWFGADKDTVSLDQIKQIPGVVGVVPALHYLPAGEAWEMEDVQKMYDFLVTKMDGTEEESWAAWIRCWYAPASERSTPPSALRYLLINSALTPLSIPVSQDVSETA